MILGPLQVSESGRPVPLGAPKQRALLAVLLLHANEVVSRERLIDELWGDSPPARAPKLVQHYVSGLRKVLPAGCLLTRAPGYLLRVEPGQLDLIEFERLLEEAKRATADGAVERGADLYRHALSLWRGRTLGDVALESHAGGEAARLDDLRLAATVERIELELELGRNAELAGELETLVARHPYQERLRGQLMLALYRSGRQAEALEAYQKARRTLVDELGLEPSQELQRLERAMLRQDPSLELPRPTVRPPAPAEAPPRRKTVTVLVCALAASPADPEALRHALTLASAEVGAAAERHGGTAERLAGGELLAVFGVPEAHEDDAIRGLRAAADVRAALPGDVRIGIATGEVLAEGTAVTGEAVAAAERLAHAAAGGEILAAESTLALAGPTIESAGPLVLAIAEERPSFPARSEAPLAGRGAELARLRELFDAVAAERRCRVVTVFGEAGVGKSRVARELVASLAGQATALVGRCVSYGEGATYLPLREAFRGVDAAAALAGTEEAELVARRVAELTGEAEGATPTGEGFWAVRRLLEALARERPLVLVLEDVHWAEPTFLDLVEYLAEWSTEAPILVLCVARPELIDARPAWGGPTSPIASIVLEPLSASESEALVGALAGGLTARARARIADVAEGNPLYAEQLAAHAEDAGEDALAGVPPTIDALLASRLDRLPAGERATLERAAVVGREFWHRAIVHLSPSDQAAQAGRHLLALASRGLVRPGRSPKPHGDAFRFHHVLIRDVAYGGMPKETRAELHELHADWLEQHDADDALVGYHLEQAYRLRAELGRAGGRTRRLAVGSGRRLAAAGVRAWRVGDAPAGANLLGRAAALLPEDEPLRPETLRELGSALWAVGEVEGADAALVEAIDAAVAAGDRGSELRGRLDLAYRQLFADPEGRAEELLGLAARAVPVFETLDDQRSLGWAWLAVAYVHGGCHGQYGASLEAAERALAHYREHGWVPAMCVREIAAALYYGPVPVPVALDRCGVLLEDADRGGQAGVRTYLAGLEAMEGRFDRARSVAAEARRAYEELGRPASLSTTWAPVAAEIETAAGDLAGAERMLRESCAVIERLGQTASLATQTGRLADVLCTAGRIDEAERWAKVSERCAATGDFGAQLAWRAAQARVLARRGDRRRAEALGHEAARLAEGTDALNRRAGILLDLAEVLRLGGEEPLATRQVEEALALYRQKGNRAAVERARGLLHDTATV
jgi:DNA-binding SARP family transcriptional activator